MTSTRLLSPAPGAPARALLIKHLLLSSERYSHRREIVYADRRRHDYATFQRRVRQLANVLVGAGVRPGDTVAVLDWDSHRYLESFFAVPMIGAVLHTVNVRLAPEQIVYTMNHAEDAFVLVHDDFLPLVEKLRPALRTVRGWLRLSDAPEVPPAASLPLVGEYEAALATASADFDFPDFDENSVATLFYTTGTVGDPKGVCFSHRQLVLHTLNLCGVLGAYDELPVLRSKDVYMPITPLFHVHAWGVPYLATMMGLKQVYPGRYDPDTLLRLRRAEGVTFSHCVPAILQMMLASPEGRSADLRGWNVLIGGSALSPGLARAAAERGISVYAGYGMSETCPVLSVCHLSPEQQALPLVEQVPARIQAGVPVPLVDLRILDDEGSSLPHDGHAVGEIVARAPWLTQGYLQDPARGAELWRGGWLHTGDVGSIDPSGVVQIRDRIKDVIKTGGEWLSSLELEALISLHPAVAEVAVVGLPDERWGERPHALVVGKAGEPAPTRDTLADHLQAFVAQDRLPRWAIPDSVRVVADIPKTSVGKIDKKRIRALLEPAANEAWNGSSR